LVALQDIPFGKTRTYLEQAKVLGDVKAIRAVAAVKNHCGLCCLVIALSGQMFRLQAMQVGYGVKVVAGTRSPSSQQSLF
jgi:methylated-DNA-[protein]-cysteine S-methyltransferase